MGRPGALQRAGDQDAAYGLEVLATWLQKVFGDYRRVLAAVSSGEEIEDRDRDGLIGLGMIGLTHHRHALSHAFAGAERADPIDWAAGMVLRFASEGLVMLWNGTTVEERHALPLWSEADLEELLESDATIDEWVDAHLPAGGASGRT
jgi:hypothetical protein